MRYILSSPKSKAPLTKDGRLHASAEKTGYLWHTKDHHFFTSPEEAQEAAASLQVNYSRYIEPPYAFIDVDSCIDEDGNYDERAKYIIDQLKSSGVYFEHSQSGRGIHLIGKCTPETLAAVANCKKNNKKSGLEFYTHERHACAGYSVSEGDQEAYFPHDALINVLTKFDMFNATQLKPVQSNGSINYSSDEIQRKLNETTPVIGGEPEPTLLNRVYNSGHGQDASSDDFSLMCEILKSFPNISQDQAIEIFSGSPKAQREKWSDREGYRNLTYKEALNKINGVIDPKAPDALQQVWEKLASLDAQTISREELFLSAKRFKRISSGNFIDMLKYKEINSTQVKEEYCARHFYVLNAQDITQSPGKVWSYISNIFEAVKGVTVDYNLPQGAIVNELVNIAEPIQIEMQQGDCSLPLTVIEKMFEDQESKDILINYLAAVVQYPSKPFRYAILIQGSGGTGKSMLFDLMYDIFGRNLASRSKRFYQSDFSQELANKVFVFIDEFAIPQNKLMAQSQIEKIKEFISNKSLSISRKGLGDIEQSSSLKFVFASNQRNGSDMLAADRRFCILLTAAQGGVGVNEAVKRFGSAEEYASFFKRFAEWAANGGPKIFANYLNNYKINPELNPVFAQTPVLDSQKPLIEEAFDNNRTTLEILCENVLEDKTVMYFDDFKNQVNPHKTTCKNKIARTYRDLGFTRWQVKVNGNKISILYKTDLFKEPRKAYDYLINDDQGD